MSMEKAFRFPYLNRRHGGPKLPVVLPEPKLGQTKFSRDALYD